MRRPADIFGRLLRGIMTHGQNLTQKTVRGAVWMVMSSGFDQILRLVQTVIVVRLLSTEDIGIFYVAMFAVGYSRVLTEAGISQALIQKKEVDREVLDTALVIQILRNLGQFVALWLLAGPAALYFKSPAVEPILRVVGVKFLISALRSPGTLMAIREMRFKRHEIFERTYSIVGLVATVTAAFILRSPWAFVIGILAMALADLVGSYVMWPYRPGFRFRMKHARELIHFGKHIYIAGIVGQVAASVDGIVLGRVLGLDALGIYSVVKNLASRPGLLLNTAVSTVTFSAYSRLQHDIPRLGAACARVLSVIALVAFPTYAGLCLVAPNVVTVFLTEKYAAGIVVCMIFCAMNTFSLFSYALIALFKGSGNPAAIWIRQAICTALAVPLTVYLTLKLDAAGAALARTTVAFVSLAIGIGLARRLVGIPIGRVWAAVSRSLAATAVMVAVLLPLVVGLADTGALWLVILCALGVAAYAGATLLVNRPALREVRTMARGMLEDADRPAEGAGEAEGGREDKEWV